MGFSIPVQNISQINFVKTDIYLPLSYILPNREATFKTLSKHLVRLCKELDQIFYPDAIVDFESATFTYKPSDTDGLLFR